MLVMVRNLNYEAESTPPVGSKGPYFRVKSRQNVTIPVTLPGWLKAGEPVDFLTGKQLTQVSDSNVMRVKLPELGAFALVWVANSEHYERE